MGDRGNVFVINGIGKVVNGKGEAAPGSEQYEGVYLYTHWSGAELPATVADALDSKPGRGRWSDGQYLTRIIFDHVAGYYDGDKPSETGAGISSVLGDNSHDIIVVDPAHQRVRLAAEGLERTVTDTGWLSFEAFIQQHRGGGGT